jgi:hypothetical protein
MVALAIFFSTSARVPVGSSLALRNVPELQFGRQLVDWESDDTTRIYSLRPIKKCNLVFLGQISGGMKRL